MPAIIFILRVTALLLLGFSMAGFWGGWSSLFDLACHFRVQYTIIASILLLMAVASKQWLVAGIAGVCLLTNGFVISPYYKPQNANEMNVSRLSPPISLLHLNVLKVNSGKASVLRLIQEKKPDLVSLLEVDKNWIDRLNPVLNDYPYQLAQPQDDNFGIALYSKIPLKNMSVIYFGKDFHQRYFPSIYAESKDERLSILVTHPLPPISGFEVRNTQLREIAKARTEWYDNALVVGDLNITPWSVFFQRFLSESDLRDSQKGFGIQPSWPTAYPLLGIPIDHVLVSPKIQVTKRETGPFVGSDHLPVYVELRLPADGQSEIQVE